MLFSENVAVMGRSHSGSPPQKNRLPVAVRTHGLVIARDPFPLISAVLCAFAKRGNARHPIDGSNRSLQTAGLRNAQ